MFETRRLDDARLSPREKLFFLYRELLISSPDSQVNRSARMFIVRSRGLTLGTGPQGSGRGRLIFIEFTFTVANRFVSAISTGLTAQALFVKKSIRQPQKRPFI